MNFNFLTKSAIFQGVSEVEAEALLKCLLAVTKQYQKGDFIYHAGDLVTELGLVLSGGVQIVNDDIWGNRSILEYVEAGQTFAEAYACVPNEPMMVSVTAAESDTAVLFLNVENLLSPCLSACSCHTRLIRNLLAVSAQKNLTLTRKIFHTTPKSIRGRLLSYLSFQAVRQKSRQFCIPFNRQQLADYLLVDRSALSNELGKMRQDGLLTFEKNRFCLTDKTVKNLAGKPF